MSSETTTTPGESSSWRCGRDNSTGREKGALGSGEGAPRPPCGHYPAPEKPFCPVLGDPVLQTPVLRLWIGAFLPWNRAPFPDTRAPRLPRRPACLGWHPLTEQSFIFNPISRHLINNCFFPAQSPREIPCGAVRPGHRSRRLSRCQETLRFLTNAALVPMPGDRVKLEGTTWFFSLSSFDFCDSEANPRDETNPSSCWTCLACCHQTGICFPGMDWRQQSDTGQHKPPATREESLA